MKDVKVLVAKDVMKDMNDMNDSKNMNDDKRDERQEPFIMWPIQGALASTKQLSQYIRIYENIEF